MTNLQKKLDRVHKVDFSLKNWLFSDNVFSVPLYKIT